VLVLGAGALLVGSVVWVVWVEVCDADGATEPGKTLVGRLIGVLFFDDGLELPSSLAASAKAAGSRPLTTASWRARYGLRPLAICWLTCSTVGVSLPPLAARATAASAPVAGFSKFAPQFGVRSVT
jgi:hypothetical protein